jgi:hypothetical protein
MPRCQHCASEFEQPNEGCCPVCGQALALPADEKDVWFSYHPMERLFQQACAAFLEPPCYAVTPTGGTWRWFLISLVLFVLSVIATNLAAKVAVLVVVLLVHELGHFAGMWLFGYQDVQMFFIPFMGAAVSGFKERAPVWQRAIVLLLGPAPGLLLGCLLWMNLFKAEHPVICEFAGWFVAINVLNLAPLEPLDGGKLVTLLLAQRSPRVEAGLVIASAVGLVLVGEFVFGSWALFGIAVLVLLDVPRRYAAARAARELLDKWPDLPEAPSALTLPQLRDLYKVTATAFPTADLATAVANMKDVHERAAVPPLSLPAKATFLAVGAGLVWFTFYTGSYEAVPNLVLPKPPQHASPSPDDGEPGLRRGK